MTSRSPCPAERSILGIRQIAVGSPELATGSEYVVFLWTGKSGLTQIIGLSQGLFLAVKDAAGNIALTSRPAADEPDAGPKRPSGFEAPIAAGSMVLRWSEAASARIQEGVKRGRESTSMRLTWRRTLMLAASLAAVSSVASGYAHWVFYGSRSAPFNGVPAIFNLGSLTNNTVSYFISEQTPGPLMPGDSALNVVSQIQAAAAVWNTVPSSTIRVAFGGFAAIGAPQTAAQITPGIDVVFDDDVTPGLVAQTRLTLPSDLSIVAKGAPFVPILRSTITLRRNLTTPFPMGSYYDVFFMTVVHEFGHALGLQHTLTSGVMSTTYTSATTKAAPLSADDIAGISLLYPTQTYAQGTGTVSGTVLVAGQGGVNMAQRSRAFGEWDGDQRAEQSRRNVPDSRGAAGSLLRVRESPAAAANRRVHSGQHRAAGRFAGESIPCQHGIRQRISRGHAGLDPGGNRHGGGRDGFAWGGLQPANA